MKKGLYSIVICAIFIVFTGCGDKDLQTKCSITSDNVISGYKLEATYNIYGSNGVVNKVKTKEVYTSDDASIITYFEDQLKSSFEAMDLAYGGYKYDITKTANSITSDVTIDYTKMDMTKLLKDQSVMKKYTNKNNKITIEGIKELYQSMGATCEK